MQYEKHVLPNGLRLLTISDQSLPTVTVMALVEAGSKYERKEVNGISHFLEHMCFKGTTKRPGPRLIAEELDSLGAQYNAFTGQEYTGYYAKVARGKEAKALEIVTDLYQNPLFDEGEINRERGVIIEEMNMYEDIPSRRVQDDILALMYGDQPAGWTILGESAVIGRVTREDFLHYRGEHYLPQSTIMVVAGACDPKAICAQVEELTRSLPAGEKVAKVSVSTDQDTPRATVRFKQSDQSHVVVGWHGYALGDDRAYATRVLTTILGGTMSSRLWQKVREELGAAYYVRASHDAYSDHGVFQISAGLDTDRLPLVLSAMIGEVCRLVKEGVTDEELTRARDSITGTFVMGLERSDDLAEYYGLHEVVMGEMLAPEEFIARINAVTKEECTTVAQEIFVNEHANCAIIGPHKDAEQFVPLLTL